MKVKRYERMSKEEIVGLFENICGTCDGCPLYDEIKKNCKYAKTGFSCNRIAKAYLNEEIKVKKVPRIATINTVDELKEAIKDQHILCRNSGCSSCKLGDDKRMLGVDACFKAYLAQEIEIEVEPDDD